MKCKRPGCGREIFQTDGRVLRTGIWTAGTWLHSDTQEAPCGYAEPEQTEARRDVELLRQSIKWDETDQPSWAQTRGLYRTVIRLAEKAGLE